MQRKMKSIGDDAVEIPPCGAYCKNCVAYKKKCEGCIETGGKPYYIEKYGKDVCPIWECTTKLQVKHCGLCKDFPCDLFLEWYDKKRGITPVLRRVGLLALRRKIGTDAWVKWLEDKKIEFGT